VNGPREPKSCAACHLRPSGICTTAGSFESCSTSASGESELDYVALVDCADALGQGDASVSWNFAYLASHHWMLGMFAPAAQSTVWGEDPDTLIASSFVFPAGRARKSRAGNVLSVHRPVSSGVVACGGNMLASVVASDDEADGVDYRLFLLNRRDYAVDDTWNAAGLRGT
jgi:3-hydroxy-9,10-secoandrosta-1,3,5(10)-triene-9,17-dione monooxygenase